MSLNSCPFCEQVNPAGAKFCNACGGALHLVPCPRCGAVSDVTATTCYQCHSQLPGPGADELGTAAPVAEVSTALPHRTPRVIVGTAVLAAVVVLGYFSVRQLPLVDAPEPQPASLASSPPGTPLVEPTPEVGTEQRADRETVELPQAKYAAGLSARPQAANAARAGSRAPPRQELCTEAAAALGLCTMNPVQKKGAEAAAASKATIGRPEATGAGKAGARSLVKPAKPCSAEERILGFCS